MSLPFPQIVLSQHIIALGKTRAGKSSKLRLIVERLLEHNEPVCIIDPKGDWWGLKSSADGKHAGYPVVIFGGDHADVPLNPRAGAAVAELIATGNRPSLIDLGGWMVGERTRFFIDFAASFFKLTRGRQYLVIDEVHNFAPQGKVLDVDAGKMLHWANRLASEGSGKGVTIIAASQRPQKVHKDFVTSCETLVACRVVHKLDRDAIKDWIDGCADPTTGRQVLTELAGMDRPEAWVWSPEAGFGPKRITFPMFRTYDSFKPQEASQAKLKGWAEVDLAEVRTKLETVVAEAEANDPKMLKKRIADLERQVASAGRGDADVAYKSGYDTGRMHGIGAAEQAGFKQFQGVRGVALNLKSTALRDLEELREIITESIGSITRLGVPEWQKPAQGTVTMHPAPATMKPATRRALQEVAKAAMPKVARSSGNGSGAALPEGQRRVLNALIQYPQGRTRSQLLVISGYSERSLSNYVPPLRQAGYVEDSGNMLIATDAGRAALPDAEPLPRGRALQEYWLSRLNEGERRTLQVLLDARGQPVSRALLLERTNYAERSLSNYLPRLAARGLVVAGRGELRASEDLFG